LKAYPDARRRGLRRHLREVVGVFLKAAGALFVLGTTIAAGTGVARALEEEVRELRRLEIALSALSSEVSYMLRPLPMAMIAAGKRAGGTVGELLCLMGDRSGISGRRTPEDVFLSVLEETGLEALPRFARDLLGELVKTLGTSGHKEQIRLIDMSIDRVRSFVRSVEGEYEKKARMYRHLGVLTGLAAVIVLI
jgi:stage III sporulation protein AB